eukprot:CAMPEP_0185330960 /NCGR_PEP_ID=MMETSP1363-20130426/78310_1 /TAXON_ID=38817 /ORGANISM="Gephyrocapsa oceanica, Strain RCC1303" /LENGTH=91 /DNA_ID=CAMNT_0027929825 /DNA_START=202 /DNA_END=474 /DNA_ORIENTATION=+
MPWMGRQDRWTGGGRLADGGGTGGGCGRGVVGAAAPMENCGEQVVNRLWTGGGRAVVGEASALLVVRPAVSACTGRVSDVLAPASLMICLA